MTKVFFYFFIAARMCNCKAYKPSKVFVKEVLKALKMSSHPSLFNIEVSIRIARNQEEYTYLKHAKSQLNWAGIWGVWR